MPTAYAKKLREYDIRPSIHKERMKDAFNADLQKLQNRKGEFVRVDCPACDSKNCNFAFEKYAFNFDVCQNCETVFMNPRATPQILNEFYEHCLVEVGAGFGIFCEEIIKSKRFDYVIAIEPVASLARTCRSKAIYTIEDSIENIESLENPPNVLVAFEVIEHVFSPKSFLRKCNRLMAPNSIIAVTCPNYLGFNISTLGQSSESIDAEHINLFNPVSIQRLFESCGFSILDCSTPGKLDTDIVRNQILKKNYNVSSQPFLKSILIDHWDELGSKFQTFLNENSLSSHMRLIAQKN